MTTAAHLNRTQAPAAPGWVDTFPDDVPVGSLVGTTGPDGALRRGVDVEGRMGADNGAARLRPLDVAGWGREGLAWEPVERRAGRAFSVHVLNGHHASQTYYPPETLRARLRRWAGQLRRAELRPRPQHFESIAVGLFTSEGPSDPITQGHGLVVHSATQDNGELWAGVCGRPLAMLRGLQNLPLAVVVVLRERGAAYYAATIADDPDLPALPVMRPLAIDPDRTDHLLYPGVHQRILGEVGYRVDTRIYRAESAHLSELATWYGTAVVADRLVGTGLLDGTAGEQGGPWVSVAGAPARSDHGAAPGTSPASAVTVARHPLGLVHVRVRLDGRAGEVGLLLRADSGGRRCFRLVLTPRETRLEIVTPGSTEIVASTRRRVATRQEHSLQVVDDGRSLGVCLDGALLFGGEVADSRLSDASGVGFHAVRGRVRDFEAHPRAVAVSLGSVPGWPQLPESGPVLLDERFDGTPEVTADLDGSSTPSGSRTWERSEGQGHFDLVPGGGVRVRANTRTHNPGRTIYTTPWDDHGFIDVTASMVPAGERRGQGHKCRTGLVLWQDPRNYLVVNVWVDDHFPGTSVSTFYRVDGHENMYDAVWTLTAERVTWGRPFDLRVVCDGDRFVASVDGRPALYRAVRDVYPEAPDLRIQRVGLIANEEWGDDTGSLFTRVVAAGRVSL